MRISQIARRLSITPTEIVEFLRDHGKPPVSHHAKLDDEMIGMILCKYQRDPVAEDAGKRYSETTSSAKTVIEAEQSVDDNEESNASTSVPESGNKEPELIEIPKPKLKGVKVVGKIDLPAKPAPAKPEKEELLPETTAEEDNKKGSQPVRKKTYPPGKTFKKRKAPQKPLTYQEKIQLEEERKEKKKQARKKREKEKKRQHYVKKVQNNPALSAKKPDKKSRVAAEKKEILQRRKPDYKNPLRKLWGWLNGEYDDIY